MREVQRRNMAALRRILNEYEGKIVSLVHMVWRLVRCYMVSIRLLGMKRLK